MESRHSLIYYEAQHHFKFSVFFHNDYETFKERQLIDIQKCYAALMSGYHMIRIDYTQIKKYLTTYYIYTE